MINGVGLNMKMFISLIENFTKSFNSGRMPVISSAWTNLLESECLAVFEESKSIFDKEVTEFINNPEDKKIIDTY